MPSLSTFGAGLEDGLRQDNAGDALGSTLDFQALAEGATVGFGLAINLDLEPLEDRETSALGLDSSLDFQPLDKRVDALVFK